MIYDEEAFAKRRREEEAILDLVTDEELRAELKRKFALLRESSVVVLEPRSWEPKHGS